MVSSNSNHRVSLTCKAKCLSGNHLWLIKPQHQTTLLNSSKNVRPLCLPLRLTVLKPLTMVSSNSNHRVSLTCKAKCLMAKLQCQPLSLTVLQDLTPVLSSNRLSLTCRAK